MVIRTGHTRGEARLGPRGRSPDACSRPRRAVTASQRIGSRRIESNSSPASPPTSSYACTTRWEAAKP